MAGLCVTISEITSARAPSAAATGIQRFFGNIGGDGGALVRETSTGGALTVSWGCDGLIFGGSVDMPFPSRVRLGYTARARTRKRPRPV